jgi:hypothetical protein
LAELTSRQQPIATPQETSLDQAFHDVEFGEGAEVRINNFVQSNLDQSRPVPRHQGSSNAFKGAKFAGKVNINNHCQNFGQYQPL